MSLFILPSEMNFDSRPEGYPVYQGSGGVTICTWSVFWQRVRAIQAFVEQSAVTRWILASEDLCDFTVAFLAVVRAGRELVLPANVQSGAIAAVLDKHSAVLGDDQGESSTDSQHPDAGSHFYNIRDLYQQMPSAIPGTHVVAGDSRIVLYTSGSTGEPREVPKQLRHIEAELQNLFDLWGAECWGKTVYASVSHRHLYGMLFFVLLPICAGNPICTESIFYPESLMDLRETPLILVGSPAFYKRLVESELRSPGFSAKAVFFSSGGALEHAVAEKVSALGVSLYEIYGSTETGGIAWRKAPDTTAWVPFQGISVRTDADARVEIMSPYLSETAWVPTGDRGYFDERRALHFSGRVDSVVKIEEKRVSLTDVEAHLSESLFVSQARVISMEDSRQYLAAVVVLTPAGKIWFEQRTKLEANRHFKDWLARWFEPSVLPRKWRFLEKMPLDSMGKVRHSTLVALFSEKEQKIDPDVHSVLVSGTKLSMELSFDPDCLWFAGHFDGTPVLPGVVQFDWLMKATERYMNLKLRLISMSRIKFTRPILPKRHFVLEVEISEDGKRLVFKYYDQSEGYGFSSGKLNVERVT